MDKTAEVLARLREQRARLQGELAGVESAIAALEETIKPPEPPRAPPPPAPAPPAVVVTPLPPPSPPPPPPRGPYYSLEFLEAVAMVLKEAGEPKRAKDIAAALIAGGYSTRSTNFAAVVRSMMTRQGTSWPFGIRGDGYGLYWYEKKPDPDAST